MKCFRLLLVCVLLLTVNAYASDLAKEKRWADQVVDAIIDGDAVWLNDGKSDFLGIYTEAEEASARSAIIMHGTGVHPDWQQVVQPLRVGLTEHGWNTLSIQMPILGNDAKHEEYAPLYDEVAPRIDAAIAYLKDNGAEKIVLIGHSQGAAMAAYYLSGSKQDVNGFVAIGIPGSAKDVRMNGAHSIEKIKIPVLDLYGTEDLESVLASTKSRHAAAEKAGNKNYIQKEIQGNHFYDGNDEGLVEAVSVWLKALK
jgi:predicted esterase